MTCHGSFCRLVSAQNLTHFMTQVKTGLSGSG